MKLSLLAPAAALAMIAAPVFAAQSQTTTSTTTTTKAKPAKHARAKVVKKTHTTTKTVK